MMRKLFVLALLVVIVSLFAACAPSDPEKAAAFPEAAPAPVEIPDEVKAKLKSTVKMLGGSLKGKLVAELNEKGTVEAMQICADAAMQMTAEASSADVFVHRVSLKTRNTANAPSPFERAQLERLEALNLEGKLPEGDFVSTEENGQNVVYFFKPLVIEQACLQCHGPADGIDLAVMEELEERYPEDQAIGYAEGDLRGAFVARTILPSEPVS